MAILKSNNSEKRQILKGKTLKKDNSETEHLKNVDSRKEESKKDNSETQHLNTDDYEKEVSGNYNSENEHV